MGNYRFRLSDMMPNAWFYKLKDMGKPRNPNISNSLNKKHLTITSPIPPSHHQNHPNLSLPRNSSNLSHKATQFLDSPSKTRTKRRRRRKTSSKTTTCTCHAALPSVPKPDSPPSHKPVFSVSSYPTNPSDGISSWSSSSSPTTDIIIDLKRQNSCSTTTKRYEKSSTYIDAKTTFSNVRCEKFSSYIDTKSSVSNHKYEKFDEFSESKSDCGHQKLEKFNGFESISELKLPPILTKPPKHDDLVLEFAEKGREPQRGIRSSTRNAYTSISVKDDGSPVRRLSSLTTQGLKIRANSPRLASKKIQAYHRKSSSTSPVSSIKTRKKRVTESLVVVKSSFDPQRDFRDSMMEMIIENNIRTSKDLEELLACYLSLNSDEYHGMIVKVFEQIWFDLTEI